MRKNFIIQLAVLLVAVALFTHLFLDIPPVETAQAATSNAHNFVFRGAQANPYVVLVDKYTGNIVNKTTGALLATNDWTDQAISASQHGYSDFFIVAIPPLSNSYEYLICIGDNATPVETDTVTTAGYSAETKCTINDGNPWNRGQLLTK